MKKILIAFFLLFIAAGASFYYYVTNLDWNQHKDKIAGQIMSSTGKKIVFDGKVSFSLFPQPYLEAKDVRIYNQNSDEALAQVPNLVAKLELLPLLKGAIKVKSMTLLDPSLNFKISEQGRLNWEQYKKVGDFGPTSEKLELNNAVLKNAKINFVDELNDISAEFKDITAEVYVESLSGPYRMEGSFVENGETFNFVFAIGTHLDGYATPLNVAIIHAPSESYLRFDGSMTIENNALTGDIVAESKLPLELMNKIYSDTKLDEKYNVPLVITSELKSNRSRIDFANFVIKYGQNIGAGNILIPVVDKNISAKEQKKLKIEALFEMTDLDMDLISGYIKDKITFYKGKENKYVPNFNYDLAFDLKSLKTFYKNQELQDFSISLDIKDQILVLKNMTVIVPGNSKIATRGRIFSENEKPAYNIDVAFVSDDFAKMLAWLDMTPVSVAPATYKNAQGAFNMAGSLQDIKFSPIKFTLDKMEFTSTVNYISDIRDSWTIAIETPNSVNFDNYMKPLDEQYLSADFLDRLLERFKQTSLLNNADFFVEAKFAGGVLDKTPFGKTELSAEVINGKMDLKNLQISDFYDANVKFSGSLSGFGKEPVFEQMNYDISANNFASFWNNIKFTDSLDKIKKKGEFFSHGVLNGNISDLYLRSVTAIGNTDIVYDGNIKQPTAENEEISFAGSFEVKAADFTKFMEDFFQNKNYDFLPKSLFRLSAKVDGVADKIHLSDFNTFIGMTNITGDVTLLPNAEKPKINGEVYFSTLDLNNFIFTKKETKDKSFVVKRKTDDPAFINKPSLSKQEFDYTLFKSFDFEGKIVAPELKISSMWLNNMSANIQFSNEKIQIKDLIADIAKGNVKGNLDINLNKDNELSGNLSFSNQSITDMNLSGSEYGLVSGTGDFSTEFKSVANSIDSMVENFAGEISFTIKDTSLKGINLMPIYEDLLERENSDGLREFANTARDTGFSDFSEINGKMMIDNNKFSFEKTDLTAPEYFASLSGGGNFADWDMNLKMEIAFPGLQEMPSLYFDLSGSMANPQSSLSVEEIVEKYDRERQQLIDEMKKRQEEKEQQTRAALLEQIAKIKQVEDKINKELIPDFAQREAKVKYQKIKKAFLDAKENSEKILAETKDLIAMENNEKISESDIALVSAKYDEFMKRISDIEMSVTGLYENETKQEYDAIYDESIALYKKTREQVDAYKSSIEGYQYTASDLKPALDFSKDEKFNELSHKIETEYLPIDKAYSAIIQSYSDANSDISVETMENNNKENAKLIEEARKNLDAMVKYIEETLDYARRQIDYAKDPELKIADEKKAEEEAAHKKAEEAALIAAKAAEENEKVSNELKQIRENTQSDDVDTNISETVREAEKAFLPNASGYLKDNKLLDNATNNTVISDEVADIEKLENTQEDEEKLKDKVEAAEKEAVVEQPPMKPKFEMREVSGEIKEATGKIKRTDVDEKPVKEPSKKLKKPSFLHKVIGEIKEVTGTFLKKD